MNAVAPTAAFKVGNFDKGERHGAVSRQWISRGFDEKYLSLSALLGKTKARREIAVERRIDTSKIEFFAPEPKTMADIHDLSMGLPGGDVISPTHYSFGQLCGLAKAPAGHYRTLPSQIVSDALTYGMRYNRAAETVKLYSAGDELRAATGPEYGRIYDAEVVEAVMQIAGEGLGDARWKIPGVLDWQTMIYNPDAPVTIDSTTLYASDHDVFIFLVDDRNPIEVGKLPDGSPDLMFRGFYVTNSETGSGALKIVAFYLRAVCMNRNLWGVEGFEEISMIHSKYAPSRFIEEARPALASFANGSTKKLIDGVNAAKAAKVADNEEDAISFLASRKFTRSQIASVLETAEREEGRPARTVWDMAQGITAVARNISQTDDRIAFELEARKLLDKVAA